MLVIQFVLNCRLALPRGVGSVHDLAPAGCAVLVQAFILEFGVFFLGQRTSAFDEVLKLCVVILRKSGHDVGLFRLILGGEIAGGDYRIQIHQPFVFAVQLVAGVTVRAVISQSVQIGIGDNIENAEPCSLILVDIDGIARSLVVVENGRDILVENARRQRNRRSRLLRHSLH